MIILESNESKCGFEVSENTTEAKILGFLNLSTGWHFGSGQPPSEETVQQALSILYSAQIYSLLTDAIPGVDGEVQILCFNEDETLEFTIKRTDEITYVREQKGTEISYYENLNLKDSLKHLFDYGNEKCNLSESSIQITTSSTKEDLAVWHSVIPATEAEYRLY